MPGRMGPGHLDEAGIRARLRIATAAQHERLDCALAYVIDAALTRDRYVDLLDAMLGFYAPFEQQLASWHASGVPGLPVIHRARLLARDLQALGRDPRAAAVCTALPVLSSVDHAAGAMYVVEGACLGGQVIARTVRANLGIDEGSGLAFFIGDGRHTGARWQRVLAWLDARDRDEGMGDEIVEGARRTFVAMTEWLAVREVLDERPA